MHINKVHSVKTIDRVARELGASVDWLFDIADEMDTEDGVIWVYGLNDDGMMALTEFRIRETHSPYRDAQGRPHDPEATEQSEIDHLRFRPNGYLFWPGMVQTIFRDAAFVGNEAALIRVTGMTVMVIGWLYLFGGFSGGRRFVAAGILDRVVLVPLVLVPLAIAGVFPHFLLAFAVLDPTLGIGAWLLLSRSDRA